MMSKPTKTLELHYPMIQFLIINYQEIIIYLCSGVLRYSTGLHTGGIALREIIRDVYVAVELTSRPTIRVVSHLYRTKGVDMSQ